MSNTNNNMQSQTSSVLHNDIVSSCSTSKVQEKTQLSRSRCMNSLKEVKSQFKFLSETLQDFALNVDSLKVDLVVIQNTCSEKADSNSETASSKSIKESSLDSARMKSNTRCQKQKKDALRIFDLFIHTFKSIYKSNLTKDEFQVDGSMGILLVVNNSKSKLTKMNFKKMDPGQMTDKYFVKYTRIEYDRRVNKRQMQTKASKIDTGKAVDADLDDNIRSGNDTDANNADIRPIYDEEPMAKEQLNAEYNIFAIGQHHTEKPEIINEGRVDQYHEQCQVKCHMLDSSPNNQTTKYSKQSLES
ncbi:hypothetical protein Tco_0804363 [Tanacetum coccineum]|uniref:Uncharacterized protein n=1 Tax=Tanacetum coccineum TaxID=301880 RepID=A0ABQ5A443_9ASTR